MNHISIIGNIATDIEPRTTQSGVNTCNFRVAVRRRYANAQGVRESDFLTVVCWRGTADYVAKYMHKGSKIAVEGSIQVRQYDAQDGSKRTVTEIIADSVEGLDKREEGQHAQPAQDNGGFVEVENDSELPF